MLRFGKSSLSDIGSTTAPDRECAPTSDAFSIIAIDRSGNFSFVKLFKCNAPANDAGPVSYTHLTLPTNREV